MRRQVAICLLGRGRTSHGRHRASGRRGRPRAVASLRFRMRPLPATAVVARTRRSALAGRSHGGAGRAPCQRTSTWASGSIRPGMRGGADDGCERRGGRSGKERRAHHLTRGGARGACLRAGARRGAATQPYAAPRRRCGAAGRAKGIPAAACVRPAVDGTRRRS